MIHQTDHDIWPWKVEEIIEATDGRLFGELGTEFDYLSTDSRSIDAHAAFIALKGESHDGHRFVDDVIKKGVRLAIVSDSPEYKDLRQEWLYKGITLIIVSDTLKALGDLARHRRKAAKARVVAITGSNGKTTTKEMIVNVLSQKYATHFSRGNFNNEIGLPLSIFNMSRNHETAVFELGMNHPGEMGRLGAICLPDIAVITNVAPAHLEGLGSIQAVADAKGELLDALTAEGKAVLYADDAMVMTQNKRGKGKAVLYGSGDECHVRAENIFEEDEKVHFTMVMGGEGIMETSFDVVLDTPGLFMVNNALAAAVTGALCGISPEEIKRGLEGFSPVAGRLNIKYTGGGITIIDDTYNANPGSMKAALLSLSGIKKGKRPVFIMGDMLELGEKSKAFHSEIGAFAFKCGVIKLYLTGNFKESVKEGAIKAGMPEKDIMTGDKEELVEILRNDIQPTDKVLVKGSRGMRMETVVDALLTL